MLNLLVVNLFNGRSFRMQYLSVAAYTKGQVLEPTCLFADTDQGTGALPLRFRTMNGFTILNLHLIDITNQIIQPIKIPHQIDLLPGDEFIDLKLVRSRTHAE